MKRRIISFLVLGLLGGASYAQFDGAVGTEGCKAVSCTDSRIVSWATGAELRLGVQNIAIANSPLVSYKDFREALGPCRSDDNLSVVSLGDGGVATLTFDRPIKNGEGPDFAVFENSFNDTFLELAFVEVSSDGVHFVRFAATSNTPAESVGGYGETDPTKINNLAGKYRSGWGTPFDLEELSGSENLDINNIRFVRIIDVIGTIDPAYATRDSHGNIVVDPYPTDSYSGGFDLDGVAVLHGGEPYIIADFSSLLAADALYDHKATTEEGSHITYFESDIFKLTNHFTYPGDYWDGFALSRDTNKTDVSSMKNGHTAFPAKGMKNDVYVMGYFSSYGNPTGNCIVEIIPSQQDNTVHQVKGVYVTNAFVAAMSMRNGDSYAKKFGGATGNDPDWFKLTAKGYRGEELTDSVEFFLADFRFEDNTKDYIVENWRWLDLSSLTGATKIAFSLSSSDAGDYGINTPAYFALADMVVEAKNQNSITEIATVSAKCYPNPAENNLYIEASSKITEVHLYNSMGQTVNTARVNGKFAECNLSHLPSGVYFLQVITDNGTATEKIVKK